MFQLSLAGVSFHWKNYLKLKKNHLKGARSNLAQQKSFHFNNIIYNAYTVKRVIKII